MLASIKFSVRAPMMLFAVDQQNGSPISTDGCKKDAPSFHVGGPVRLLNGDWPWRRPKVSCQGNREKFN
jgi:hypothetical protein